MASSLFTRMVAEDRLRAALAEDRAFDDRTVALLRETADTPARAVLRAKQRGVFSGQAIVEAVPACVPQLSVEHCLSEGARFAPGHDVVRLAGPVGILLSVERSLLNFLTHLCGVATATSEIVAVLEGTKTKVLATRKTLPGLRDLQLTAVRAGGGVVHRRSLSDAVLVKENHQRYAKASDMLLRAREEASPLHRIEVEVQSLAELEALCAPGSPLPSVVMLDNFSPEDAAHAVAILRERGIAIEASGGFSPERAMAYAELGVDWISVGAITHSARAVDLSLDFLDESERGR